MIYRCCAATGTIRSVDAHVSHRLPLVIVHPIRKSSQTLYEPLPGSDYIPLTRNGRLQHAPENCTPRYERRQEESDVEMAPLSRGGRRKPAILILEREGH